MTNKSSVNPFQELSAFCPVCEAEQEHYRLKQTLFSEKNRDIDLRPKSVEWNPKVSPKVDPKAYFFWECDKCHFSADFKSYQTPFSEGVMSATRFRKLLRASLEKDLKYPKILNILTTDSDKQPQFIKAIRRNFLAIYQLESSSEIRDKESLKIGSYYLRMAWFIRDIKSSPAKAEKYKIPTRELLQSLKEAWSELPLTEMALLQKAVEYYDAALTQSQAIKTAISEIQIELIVIRIYLQIGKLPAAKQLLAKTKTRASSYEHLVKKKEKDAKVNDKNIDLMVATAAKAVNLVKNVEIIYEKLEENRILEGIKKAEAFIEKNGLKKEELLEQRAILSREKFDDKVIDRVCPLPKKKGLLEFLKSS